MIRTLLAIAALCFTLPALALPEALRGPGEWAARGQAEMRWFGLRLYTAELWLNGELQGLPTHGVPEQAFALRLTYARDIAGTRLVSTSLDEMARQGEIDEATRERWGKALAAVLPDVRRGDTLTGMYEPGQGARFFRGETLLGRLDDVQLARRFFGIWLDPRTREPVLRQRLLGVTR